MAKMVAWSEAMSIPIDSTIHFTNKVMEDMVSREPSQGGNQPLFIYLERGQLILTCAFHTKEDTVKDRHINEAGELPRGNLDLTTTLQLETTRPRPLCKNYNQICLCIATHAAQQWAQWGTIGSITKV